MNDTDPAPAITVDATELAHLRLVETAARHADPGTPVARRLAALDRYRRTVAEQPAQLALDGDAALRNVQLCVAVHGDALQVLSVERLRDERAAVLALHRDDDGECIACFMQHYPCPTARALGVTS